MQKTVPKKEEKVLLQKFINRALHDQRLTPWERDFLKSIEKQILNRDLTERQLAVLNRIKQKYSQK